MRQMLKSIEKGKFARNWLDEFTGGAPDLKKSRQRLKNHAIEETGRKI
jgi:ketol-acid reductoisomerase